MHRGTHRQWDHTASTKYLFWDAKKFINQIGIYFSQVFKIQVPANVFFCLHGCLTRRTELLLFIKSKQTAALNHGDTQTYTNPQTETHKSFFFILSKIIKPNKIDSWHFSTTDLTAAVSCQKSTSSTTQKSLTCWMWWSLFLHLYQFKDCVQYVELRCSLSMLMFSLMLKQILVLGVFFH